MKILLHACCGPCLLGSCSVLKQSNDLEISVFWFNPNIHPYIEYRERYHSLLKAAQILNINVFAPDIDYGLDSFLKNISSFDRPNRCNSCYEQRLSATAEFAAQNGFDAFTTTLLISPYQDHDAIHNTGLLYSQKHKIHYYKTDLTLGFKKSKELAIQHEIYRQKYCGCVFSEFERYKTDKRFSLKK